MVLEIRDKVFDTLRIKSLLRQGENVCSMGCKLSCAIRFRGSRPKDWSHLHLYCCQRKASNGDD